MSADRRSGVTQEVHVESMRQTLPGMGAEQGHQTLQHWSRMLPDPCLTVPGFAGGRSVPTHTGPRGCALPSMRIRQVHRGANAHLQQAAPDNNIMYLTELAQMRHWHRATEPGGKNMGMCGSQLSRQQHDLGGSSASSVRLICWISGGGTHLNIARPDLLSRQHVHCPVCSAALVGARWPAEFQPVEPSRSVCYRCLVRLLATGCKVCCCASMHRDLHRQIGIVIAAAAS